MSVTLALETSGAAPSVALAVGEDVRSVELGGNPRGLTGLFPLLAEIINGSGHSMRDVTLFCYSRGPGSFTGLRTAATIARTLQWSAGCRVIAVSTLEVIATAAAPQLADGECLAPILDARGGRVFAAVYNAKCANGIDELVAPGLFDPAALEKQLPSACALVGGGATLLPASARRVLDPQLAVPSPISVLERGRMLAKAERFTSPEQIVPEYLRPPECEEVYEARRAAAIERRGS